jgi:hypothetical protein
MSPNIGRMVISRKVQWSGHVARMGKRSLGRPRWRWEVSIKMDLR